uniref:ALMS motif domain-containing protein n=1 Tax=Anopheles farauti TaxID=69004 RepID=A0A182PZI4_9DIPT
MSQSDRVTDLIMHYYMEHGRNRDLEKYLRLRRMSNATRSSSDGSLPCLDELQRRGGCRIASERSGLGKSMENLATLRKKAEQQQQEESEKSLRNASAESAKSLQGNKSSTPDKAAAGGGAVVAGSSDVKGVTVKEKKVEHKSGRNFNFNLESVIEINLPPPPTITLGVPTVTSTTVAAPITYTQPETVAPSMKQLSPRIVVHENSTQTTVPEDDPIRPVVKSQPPGGNAEEPLDSTKDISPVSSIASNKQRLEWDSLGDIGYDSSERLQFCGAADLNETEKRCLQRYFARKGLTFDRSVIVVRQRDEKEKKPERRMEDASITLSRPDAQSTPKVLPQTTTKPKEQMSDGTKFTQTSLRAMESRGVQVTRRHDTQHQDKAIGTTDSYTLASVDAAESFEFFSPSVPETENNTPSVAASASTPAHSSSTRTTDSSSADGSRPNQTLRPTFDDEVKLGLTLYNSICELKSMPTGVKESLIDKIFRKLSRHDPKKRTREQLLLDYSNAVRKQEKNDEHGECSIKRVEENVYDDVSPCGEPNEQEVISSAQMDRSMDVVEVVEKTKDPSAAISDIEQVSEGSVKGSTSGSNEGHNNFQHTTSMENSSHRTVSSQPVSAGTTKEIPPRKLSAPEPRDKRVRKAMHDYLQPMTHSEVEYENFRLLQQRNQTGGNDPQLAKIDREIEQLLVRKMLLLNAAGSIAGADPTLPVKETVKDKPKPVAVSVHSGTTVYTSVHDQISGKSHSSQDSSLGWNSHYHMAQMIKNRSKLETPTELPTSPSDVSIPTFVKQKKDKFVENYDHVRQQQRRVFEEQNNIYTRPYSSGGHRSGGERRRREEKENRAFSKDLCTLVKGTAKDRRPISSSNDTVLSPEFISSDSISIPVVTTLTNTTTTHHYDIKSRLPSPPPQSIPPKGRTAGTQTTDSIMRTKPIYGEPKSKPNSVTTAVQVPSAYVQAVPECHCFCVRQQQQRLESNHQQPATLRRTEIVDGTGGRQDKQAQTKPCSVAYVITFKEAASSNRQQQQARHKLSPPNVQKLQSSSGTDIATESEPENVKDEESEKMITLREQFRRSCPATLSRIEERRQCINELNKLRNKRNQQRQRLLLLTSDDSLRRSNAIGKGQLPPPPLTQRRVFASSRAIREYTRRQVRNLPEVQRKKEIERFNNLKRKNRIIKDMYNKNLQRKVLKGQVDLSNSVRVMQD